MVVAVMEKEYTTEEVAEILRISRMSVIRRIEAKLIRARKEGQKWRILESDLKAYIRSTYPDAEPPESS